MFEAAEIGHKVDKKTWSRDAPKVREALLDVQRELATTPLSVIIVVGGVEGAGKGETVNLLLQWMDARGIETHAIDEPTDEERERPPGWRFWRRIPAKSRMGIFFGSWYTEPLTNKVFRRVSDAQFDLDLERIIDVERMLAREDTLILKFWLHLSKSAQRKRFKSLEKDPLQRWRVTKQDWVFHKKYDRVRRFAEHTIRRTNMAEAPWFIVEAADPRYRALTVTKTILSALKDRIAEIRRRPSRKLKPDRPKPKPVNIIRHLDLTKKLGESKYDKELAKHQARLNALSRRLRNEGRSMIALLEGPDAAGKGGSIRRLTGAMDARQYQEISVAAPTDEERAHPYLWRFWRHLPRQGHVTIYDRSWYGRVLVERIEQLDEVSRLGEPFRMWVVGAHHETVVVAHAGDDRRSIVLGIRHHPNVLPEDGRRLFRQFPADPRAISAHAAALVHVFREEGHPLCTVFGNKHVQPRKSAE